MGFVEDEHGICRRWGSSEGAGMGCSLRFRGGKKNLNWSLVREKVLKIGCSFILECTER